MDNTRFCCGKNPKEEKNIIDKSIRLASKIKLENS